jgi:uncharacterized protein YegP (UPF0339 family)
MKSPKVTFYKDKRGEWRWRLQSPNARIIADSAEGYETKAKARLGFARVAEYSPHAVVVL